ncbi:MAG: hypothetical protein P8Z00_04065 [Anaerolineales bacterium]|jgi:F-type H+-transporting ATPase subunit b
MQIDWFTLVAQIINFVILLYLLRRFLYDPIVTAMDQREQKIATRMQEAEQKRKEADEEVKRYNRQRQELEEEHDKRLAAIQVEIEERRKELLQEAQQEVREQKRNWQHALKEEQESFLNRLRQRVGQEGLDLARHALRDLADTKVEQRMVEMFISHIQELEPQAKAAITESIQKSESPVVICSAFGLPEELQDKISDTVQKHFLGRRELQADFQTSPDLIAGIEMQVDNHRVAWVIRDYLGGLEERIMETIKREYGEQAEAEHDA